MCWGYYEAKTTIVKYYPKPIYNSIIEPFAGTARYSLRYFENDVLLIDKYEVIVKIWPPFVPLKEMKGSLGFSKEAIWTNYHTDLNNVQQKLIL